jgi:hypothetical protein
MMDETLQRAIEHAINAHCAENDSNTPDFLLAEYMLGCLKVFNNTIRQREQWYGRDPNIGPAGINTSHLAKPDDPIGPG